MIRIADNGVITMSRGDSISLVLFLNEGTDLEPIRFLISEHPLTKVYLGIMEPNQFFEEAIVRKIYDINSPVNEEGDLIINLRPEDTEYLHPGTYYYQIKVLVDGQDVNTVIPKTLLYIC